MVCDNVWLGVVSKKKIPVALGKGFMTIKFFRADEEFQELKCFQLKIILMSTWQLWGGKT